MGTTLRNVFFLILFGLVALEGVERVGDLARERGDAAAGDEGAGGERIVRVGVESKTVSESRSFEAGDDALVLRAGRGGHFTVAAWVDGTEIDFLIDTGASLVVLSPEDAERLGLWPSSLDYTAVFETANGRARAAPVTLRDLRIGVIELEDVEAAVMEMPMATSLLGMSALRQLQGYRVDGDRMTLRW